MKISPFAGHLPPPELLTDIPKLISDYYTGTPDPTEAAQRVSFGTSGHRGTSSAGSFNEAHILAIAQAICDYRMAHQISGPLFMGMDTHALSTPAQISALEVLAANGVEVMIAENSGYTPTPAVSHAILTYNRQSSAGKADGIVITPSHNPPEDGGIKYNPPHGGPAETPVTVWIEDRANKLMEGELRGVKRWSSVKAFKAETTHTYDYMMPYVEDLIHVLDLDQIAQSGLRLGVDPLGGSGMRYWEPIREKYHLDLEILNQRVDPTFQFMSVDWDGKIRMDPSSVYAMKKLVGLKDQYDVAFACDTDYDRHGIVTKSSGLLNPNHYLSVCVHYLFRHRPDWKSDMMIGKTLVSSGMIDRVASRIGRKVLEVPVGFKWFVDGLIAGDLGFVGEESAGATLLRKDGTVWTTDKDGIAAALLSAEITAVTGKDPGEIYEDFTVELGNPVYKRIDAKATPEEKQKLGKLSPSMIHQTSLAGEEISQILTHAPGNNAAIGGLKVVTENGWFAARPSGTEDIYKIYAESFLGVDHLENIVGEAQEIVAQVLN